MKKLLLSAVIALAPLSFAVAGTPDKERPPEKAMDDATPKMKNPEGTEKLLPAQKAMDEATPTEKKSDTASSKSATAPAAAPSFPAWDIRKAGEGVNLTGGKTKE